MEGSDGPFIMRISYLFDVTKMLLVVPVCVLFDVRPRNKSKLDELLTHLLQPSADEYFDSGQVTVGS